MTNKAFEPIAADVHRWAACATADEHRYGLLLRGPSSWCRQISEAIVSTLKWTDTAWFTQPDSPADTGRRLLGGEVDGVIVDLGCPGIPDTLGAAAGAIRRGGLLIAWTVTDRASHLEDRFGERFCRIFAGAPGVATLDAEGGWTERPPSSAKRARELCTAPYLSTDQERAVGAILKAARGRSGRPAVLISDRGRGKSAALGLAAAELMRERPREIWVIAPSLASVASVFRHASQHLAVTPSDGVIEAHGGRLVYRSPAEFVGPLPNADFVMVDEAAALPLPFLQRLIGRYRRLVFATTVHGYEGTGRGFTLRFRPLLNREAPGGETIMLETPIRWRAGDPIETVLFEGLLMNADVAPAASVVSTVPNQVSGEWFCGQTLAGDESMLRRVYGLLVTAHYRTTPADLKRLLDQPGGRVFVLRSGKNVVGAAFVMVEGRLSESVAAAVKTGRRRPHGHLLPEALWAHMGLSAALSAGFWRVARIAVHPSCRRVGLGRRMLEWVAREARSEGADCWGATFGVTLDLLAFWQSADAQCVRIGVSPGRSSGLVSAIVLAPLTTSGRELTQAARRQFSDELPFALGDPLRDLSSDIALALLRGCIPPTTAQWPAYVRDALNGVADRTRGVDASTAALWRFTLAVLTSSQCAGVLDEEVEILLLRRFVQRHPWSTADARTPARGRKPLSRLVADSVRVGTKALNGLVGDRSSGSTCQ